MDGIHDHLIGDYDYEIGPGADGEFHGAQRWSGRAPSAYRAVEEPALPVIDGTFTVVGTPRLLSRIVAGRDVPVLNLVIAAAPHLHHRDDGRVEVIASPALAVALWGDDATRLREVADGSAVAVSGFLRTAAYRRNNDDPAVEVYQPKVTLLARLVPSNERPGRRALKRPTASDGYFSDEEAHAALPYPGVERHFGYDDADEEPADGYGRPDDLPARATGESDAEWISRSAEAGWSYDRENDNPFADGPTADGFSRDPWALYR